MNIPSPRPVLPEIVQRGLQCRRRTKRSAPPYNDRDWLSGANDQGGGQHMTDARYLIEPLARLTGPVPGHDPAIELQYLCFQPSQLGAESRETSSRSLRQPFVTWISDNR